MIRRSLLSSTLQIQIERSACVSQKLLVFLSAIRIDDFAAFGHVTAGMDVVRQIQAAPREAQKLTPAIKILSIRAGEG